MYSLSNFQILNTVLITTVTMLYSTSPWLTCFVTGRLYLLAHFIHFAHSLLLLIACTYKLVFYFIWFIHLFTFDSMYKWHHRLSFSIWFISRSIVPSSLYLLLQMAISFFLYGWISVVYAHHVPYTIFSLSIRRLMGTSVVPISSLLQVMLQWRWGYIYLHLYKTYYRYP